MGPALLKCLAVNGLGNSCRHLFYFSSENLLNDKTDLQVNKLVSFHRLLKDSRLDWNTNDLLIMHAFSRQSCVTMLL